MSNFISLVLLLPLLLTPEALAQNYDFFLLAHQWPATFCQNSPCHTTPLNYFTIHGMWPTRNDGKTVVRPVHWTPFNPGAEMPVDELRVYWPDLIKGDDIGFWAHEWNKHGSCSEAVLKQPEYFSKALKHFEALHLNQTLLSGGITPGDNVSLKLTDIENVILQGSNYPPIIKCDRNSRLLEVYFCISKDGYTPIICPSLKINNHCDSNAVEFPYPYSYDVTSTAKSTYIYEK